MRWCTSEISLGEEGKVENISRACRGDALDVTKILSLICCVT